MLRRLLIVIFVALFALVDLAPALVSNAFAQDQTQPAPKKRKTLFDMLFGGGEPEAPPPEVEVQKAPKTGALPTPPKPTIEKAPNATRLAVFGDSLAVDLTKALDRFYAEDPNIMVIG